MLNAGFQYLEQRDANDKITKDGVVGKNSPFATSDNSGIYDIIAENLRWLKENVDDVKDTSDLEAIKQSVTDMYNDMKNNSAFGEAAAKAQAEEAKKQAQAALESATNAKTYHDEVVAKSTEINDTIAEIKTYIEKAEKLIESNKEIEQTLGNYATVASNKAQVASDSATNAATSESNAATSAEHAATSETNAKTSETNAANSAAKAKESETNIETAVSNAATSATNAKASETNAKSSETNSKASEVSAKTYETNASNSANLAKAWAESNESPDSMNDTDSTTGKTRSSKSWALYSRDRAISAYSSESNAKASETASKTSETNAKTSETNAAKSASNAKTSESAARTSEINAKASETNAKASEDNASTSKSNAAASESNAKSYMDTAKEYMQKAQEALAAAQAIQSIVDTAKANAEKCLADVEAVKESLAKMITYQGSVDNYSDLPTSPQVGYSYNIKNADKEHGVNAGDNVVWNGTDWDNFGGAIDMSLFAELGKDVKFNTVTATLNGNAATATKLQTSRTISLTGKAAGSTTFDGSANASINVTNVNADTASKLSTARKINITGNASGSASFDGSGDVSISTTVNESKHAASATTVNATAPNGGAADLAFGTMATNDYARIRVYGKDDNGALEIATADGGGNEPIYARQYSGPHDWLNGRPGTVTNEAAILDSNGNTKFPKNVTAASFVGHLAGNADSATNADKVDGIHAGSMFYNKGNWAADNWATMGAYQVNGTALVSDAYGWGQVISSSTDDARFQLYATHLYEGDGRLHYRTGWDSNKQDWNTILDSENYNKFVPTKTGTGASGTWGINISGNAAGLSGNLAFPSIDDVATSRKITWGGSTDGADIYYQTTASDQGNLVLNLRDDDNCYLRIAYNGAFKSYFSPSDGNFHGNVNGTADNATKWNGLIDDHTTENNTDSWLLVVSGNKIQHASKNNLFRHLGGNQTPVMTDIFDRAGTIDMTTMNASDKATHKANINKASNATQSVWRTDTGIYGYGGDYDMSNGYKKGSLKLTQSYKNFDKILVVGANDKGDFLIYKLWDVWELANAFTNSHSFRLFAGGDYWTLYGSARKGTDTSYVLSTDTVWSCQDQNSTIVAIYGIKY